MSFSMTHRNRSENVTEAIEALHVTVEIPVWVLIACFAYKRERLIEALDLLPLGKTTEHNDN